MTEIRWIVLLLARLLLLSACRGGGREETGTTDTATGSVPEETGAETEEGFLAGAEGEIPVLTLPYTVGSGIEVRNH